MKSLAGGRRNCSRQRCSRCWERFARDLFNGLRIRINNRFEQNVIFDMRCEVYARLQRLPVHYFDQRSSGT